MYITDATLEALSMKYAFSFFIFRSFIGHFLVCAVGVLIILINQSDKNLTGEAY